MATVSIWECMNQYKLMMKTHSYFVVLEDMVLDLVASVIQQVTQFHGHLSPIDADVFVGLTESSSPLPSLTKHLAV